ncbi:MAG: hypothetical protein HFH72_09365 [Lachnospiraceae bacterium]|nr:hypothetical protein [Lachnospiraceae bacterium]
MEHSEAKRQDEFDKELKIIEPEVQKRRKRQEKYFRSEKGKETQRRYCRTEKGKEVQRRKTQKKIESEKNSECCKKYYERHREELKKRRQVIGIE